MDWDNEQICHWLTAVGLGEYVQVFRGMFVKLGITGKESSAFGGFAFPFGDGEGGPRFKFNFYFLGGGHFKYLYLCGGIPKIIKILVVVPTPHPQVFFPGKALNQIEKNSSKMLFGLVCQNVFGTDCLNDLKEIYYMYLSTDNLAGTELGVLCLKYFYKLTQ